MTFCFLCEAVSYFAQVVAACCLVVREPLAEDDRFRAAIGERRAY